MVLKLHIYQPVVKLKEMLSESTAIQTLFAAEDAGAASQSIYPGYAEDSPAFDEATGDQAVKEFPRAIIALEDFSSDKSTTSSWSTRVVMSVLLQCLTLDVDKTKSLSARYAAFLQRIEGVADDLRELAASGTRLNLQNIRAEVPPQRQDIKETGGQEVWWTVLVVTAGG